MRWWLYWLLDLFYLRWYFLHARHATHLYIRTFPRRPKMLIGATEKILISALDDQNRVGPVTNIQLVSDSPAVTLVDNGDGSWSATGTSVGTANVTGTALNDLGDTIPSNTLVFTVVEATIHATHLVLTVSA